MLTALSACCGRGEVREKRKYGEMQVFSRWTRLTHERWREVKVTAPVTFPAFFCAPACLSPFRTDFLRVLFRLSACARAQFKNNSGNNGGERTKARGRPPISPPARGYVRFQTPNNNKLSGDGGAASRRPGRRWHWWHLLPLSGAPQIRGKRAPHSCVNHARKAKAPARAAKVHCSLRSRTSSRFAVSIKAFDRARRTRSHTSAAAAKWKWVRWQPCVNWSRPWICSRAPRTLEAFEVASEWTPLAAALCSLLLGHVLTWQKPHEARCGKLVVPWGLIVIF